MKRRTLAALSALGLIVVGASALTPSLRGLSPIGALGLLLMTHGGKQLLSFTPKNGHLYGFDLVTRQLLYRSPVTRIENADVPLSTDKAVHFCPGAVGGISVETDPPLQRDMRNALNPLFTPNALGESVVGEINRIVNRLMTVCLEQDGPVDLVASFTAKLPPLVFSHRSWTGQEGWCRLY